MSPTTEEWTLSTPPEEYLERWPEGPNADLAQEILAAGPLDGGSNDAMPKEERVRQELAALRSVYDEIHGELVAEAQTHGRFPKGLEGRTAHWRLRACEIVGKKVLTMEQRIDHVPLSRVDLGIRAVRRVLPMVKDLEYRAPLGWTEHERSLFKWAMKAPIIPPKS